MTQLTFRQIEVLHALLSAQGLTAGAERLNVPQSNASATLAKARRIFADPLLVRGKQKMTLTDEGARVLKECSAILSALSALEAGRSRYDPLIDDGVLRIAAVDYVQAAILPRAVAAIRRLAPNLKMALLPMNRFSLELSLENDELDLAIMPIGHAPQSLRIANLSSETFVCVVRRDEHRSDNLDIETYCRLPHILTSPSRANFRGELDDALEERGLSRRIVTTTSNFFSALSLVREAGGIVTVPKRLAALVDDDLAVLEPPIEVRGFDLVLCWHPKMHGSERHQMLRTALLDSVVL